MVIKRFSLMDTCEEADGAMLYGLYECRNGELVTYEAHKTIVDYYKDEITRLKAINLCYMGSLKR
jgi:hypothetical protein